MNTPGRYWGGLLLALALPVVLVTSWMRGAAARLEESKDAASEVAIASAAEDAYCSVQLKQVLRRVAGACGLLEGGARGWLPPGNHEQDLCRDGKRSPG